MYPGQELSTRSWVPSALLDPGYSLHHPGRGQSCFSRPHLDHGAQVGASTWVPGLEPGCCQPTSLGTALCPSRLEPLHPHAPSTLWWFALLAWASGPHCCSQAVLVCRFHKHLWPPSSFLSPMPPSCPPQAFTAAAAASSSWTIYLHGLVQAPGLLWGLITVTSSDTSHPRDRCYPTPFLNCILFFLDRCLQSEMVHFFPLSSRRQRSYLFVAPSESGPHSRLRWG